MDKRILLVGVGGIGSCILSCFGRHSYHPSLWIIDFDVVEMGNLSTQLLYTKEDVGQYKVEVARESMLKRYGMHVRGVLGRIEDQPEEFYEQFDFIIGAVDTIATRRHINSVLCKIYKKGIVWIDCGSEGPRGQVRVIRPGHNACFECTLNLYQNDDDTLPICMLRGRPQNKAQCIVWAAKVWWPKNREEEFSSQSGLHLSIVQKIASEKVQELNIGDSLVTLEEIVRYLDSRIPPMIETNDAVAEACIEVLKSGGIDFDMKTVSFLEGHYELSTCLERGGECLQCSKCHASIVLKAVLQECSVEGNMGIHGIILRVIVKVACVSLVSDGGDVGCSQAPIMHAVPRHIGKPGMVFDVIDAIAQISQSQGGITGEEAAYQVSCRVIHAFGEDQFSGEYLFVYLVCGRVVVWRCADQHLIYQYSQGPPIDCHVMASVLDDLWGKVLGSPAQCPGLLVVWQTLGKTEICQFYMTALIDQEVFWLQVPVHYSLCMQVLQCQDQL